MTAPPKKSRLRRWLRWGLIGCAVLAIATAAAGWALWHNDQQVQVTISPETTWIVEPLRDDGYVDYVAALNQHASDGVTPDNNAAVLYFRAMGPKEIASETSETFYKLLGIEPLATEGDYFVTIDRYIEEQYPEIGDMEEDVFYDAFHQAAERPWSKKDHPLLAEWLAANEKPLRLVVEGSQRPQCYWPLVGSEEDTMVIDVYSGGQRCLGFVRALRVRAMLDVDSGRIDKAWADLMTCHRLARLAGRGPSLIDALVAATIESMACQAGAALARHNDLSAEKAKQFAAELAELPPLENIADKIDVLERYVFLDSVGLAARIGPEAMLRSSGELEESLENTVNRVLTNAIVDWDHVLKMAHPWYDDMAAAARKPTRAERRQAVDEIMARLHVVEREAMDRNSLAKKFSSAAASDSMAGFFITLLMPSVPTHIDVADQATARREMTRVAFVLAAYKADNGSYPATLADLSPKYLAEVPPDIFSDGDFQYETTDDGYRLWSVGPNGVDDGGMGPDVEDHEGEGDDLLIATGR
ncbi:MAG: hypothetical protein IIA67_07490 [Planctomycetes bacterium]|nr:hypothetical protein [Planctomycetota bacterium]